MKRARLIYAQIATQSFRVLTDTCFGMELTYFGMEFPVQSVHLIAQPSLYFLKQAIRFESPLMEIL